MTVLLVEDEAGIRDGLAAVLGMRGLVVRTAADLAAAREALAATDIACVVSDWRLPDGTAAELLAELDCPCVVISGSPEDVPRRPPIDAVLDKPVSPWDLVAAVLAAVERQIEGAESGAAGGAGEVVEPTIELGRPASAPAALVALPVDVAELLAAARALLGGAAAEFVEEVVDDGVFVTWRCRPAGGIAASRREALRQLGGDLQCGEDGTVRLRCYRDGRPDGIAQVVRPDEADWPSGPLAVDLHGCRLDVDGLLELLERGRVAGPDGGPAPLLNLPAALRRGVEALGWAGQLPKKTVVGPRLPAALDQLWS